MSNRLIPVHWRSGGPYGEDRHYETMILSKNNKIAYVKKSIITTKLPTTIKKKMVVGSKVLVR